MVVNSWTRRLLWGYVAFLTFAAVTVSASRISLNSPLHAGSGWIVALVLCLSPSVLLVQAQVQRQERSVHGHLRVTAVLLVATNWAVQSLWLAPTDSSSSVGTVLVLSMTGAVPVAAATAATVAPLRFLRRHGPRAEPASNSPTSSGVDERRSVYFAERDGYVKIGTSVDPTVRLKELAKGGTHAPDNITVGPLRLLATHPGGLAVERALHHRFADSRVVKTTESGKLLATEWFRKSPELLNYIDNVRRAGACHAFSQSSPAEPRREGSD